MKKGAIAPEPKKVGPKIFEFWDFYKIEIFSGLVPP